MRYTGPKNRIARKFGANIFGRNRNPLLHKPNPPGVHGARRKKKSDFALQLEEKQKLKAVYGMIAERQLMRYYREASRHRGNTANFLLQMLECRLDVVVYRLKLAPSIFAAQQLVAHGHIQVNGKKVDLRSFSVKPGMKVSVKEKSQKMKMVQEALENPGMSVPEYLSLEKDHCAGVLLQVPHTEQISLPITINLPIICEFLAHNTGG